MGHYSRRVDNTEALAEPSDYVELDVLRNVDGLIKYGTGFHIGADILPSIRVDLSMANLWFEAGDQTQTIYLVFHHHVSEKWVLNVGAQKLLGKE